MRLVAGEIPANQGLGHRPISARSLPHMAQGIPIAGPGLDSVGWVVGMGLPEGALARSELPVSVTWRHLEPGSQGPLFPRLALCRLEGSKVPKLGSQCSASPPAWLSVGSKVRKFEGVSIGAGNLQKY